MSRIDSRNLAREFSKAANCTQKAALAWLKSYDYDYPLALACWQEVKEQEVREKKCDKLFDQYASAEDKSTIDLDNSLQLFEDLGLSLEDPATLLVSYLFQSENMGEFHRDAFVKSCLSLHVCNMEQLKSRVSEKKEEWSSNAELAKAVYRYTYPLACERGQRTLPTSIAIEFLQLLLKDSFPLLSEFVAFLEQSPVANKTLPKDTWNQLWEFAAFVRSCPDCSQYDFEGAWPVLIDEFVTYFKNKS
ncbi:neddylation protein Dcn1 [Schizosaccharomyces japonicus yFS275]|uniref:Defective in cullin neddylation protein n=1 Tax=Schizosaccharomyces japonicus (strain yFS275 / FY16936) TaxID=402676 RepID=B6JUT9_SCHJY|nr:neddylation protein Dcn1 [Schizosaccharomyces japonicus yFS275]EEB05041.1 neddylation protein Dcn1 [Schizosaccharomyces japonicus yFS275]